MAGTNPTNIERPVGLSIDGYGNRSWLTKKGEQLFGAAEDLAGMFGLGGLVREAYDSIANGGKYSYENVGAKLDAVAKKLNAIDSSAAAEFLRLSNKIAVLSPRGRSNTQKQAILKDVSRFEKEKDSLRDLTDKVTNAKLSLDRANLANDRAASQTYIGNARNQIDRAVDELNKDTKNLTMSYIKHDRLVRQNQNKTKKGI